MRILLIDPPYERLIGFRSEWFPLGLAYIAGFLKSRGFNDVVVYHAEHASDTSYQSIVKYARNFSNYRDIVNSDDHPVWKEVRHTISSFKPDVVGLSVLTPKVPSALRIARICKGINPLVKVVCGGYHPTARPEEILADPNVDFVVRGEAEEIFYALVEVLAAKRDDYRGIAGLSFRQGGQIVHNPAASQIKDIDKLPFPGLDSILNIETYTPVQLGMVMTSRGCPYDCGFCASHTMWAGKVRFRSIDSVIQEIRLLRDKYAVKNITFMDDSFTISRKRVNAFCQAMIDSRIGVTWSCLTRADIISDEVIALLKKAGCTKVDIGVESGNPRILNLINKQITLEKVRNAARILKRNGMYWSGFFMLGFPTETKEEILDTRNFLRELKPNWANMSIFTPYPGTKLYELAKTRGMMSEPVDYTLYSHQNPRCRHTDILTEGEFYSLTSEILEEVHRYNSSARSLFNRVLTRKYHKNPAMIAHDFKKVLSWLKR